eukprot:SAG31_NODE_1448_length_8310_cov_6.709171_2_plen_177_part_00
MLAASDAVSSCDGGTNASTIGSDTNSIDGDRSASAVISLAASVLLSQDPQQGLRYDENCLRRGQLDVSREPYWLRTLPRPSWLRLFYRQIDRDAAAKSADHAFLFAAEKLGGGNYYGSAPSVQIFIDEFYAHCLNAAACEKIGANEATSSSKHVELYFYEQIPSWVPCKLYLDVGA